MYKIFTVLPLGCRHPFAQKILLMTKLCLAFIMIACLKVSARSYAQEVTLDVNNSSVKSIFYQITRQTGYSFICDADVLKDAGKISLHVSRMPLREVLERCFKNMAVEFHFNPDNTIFINKRQLVAAFEENHVAITVTGKLTDEKKQPLPGVTITVKSTGKLTVSDKDGNFKIVVPDGDAVLVFSSIGFAIQEIKVGNQKVINVMLKEQSAALEEMVVIGYGTQSRRDLTGAVSSVTAAQLKDIPGNSAIQALAGRLAGVNITTTEGGPGAAVTINVRGGGSITQDNTPLYVVDGVQVENALNILAPQDIASVDVLKDAAATSIYGARGANGVVVITTKGGKAQRTAVAYNYFFGINKLAKKFDLMNPAEFIEYNWEKTRGTLTDSISFSYIYGNSWAGLDAIRNKPFVDWQQLTFGKNAINQTHNVSVTGGNRETTFNISYTNNNEQSIMVNSAYLRNLFNMKFEHSISNKAKVGLSYAYNDNTVVGAGTSTSGTVNNNRLRNSVKYRPFLLNDTDPAAARDQAYFASTNQTGYYLINPIQFAEASYRRNRMVNTNIGAFLNYTFTPYLSARATVGINKNDAKLNAFDDAITWNAVANSDGQPVVGITSTANTSVNENVVFTFNNNAFKTKFHKENRITVLLGQEFYQLSTVGQNDQVRYFPIGITPERALAQLSLGKPFPLNPTSSDAKSRIMSFFSRASYSYKDRYLATFSLRADGSSKFAPGRQWGYFPAGSFAWRVSEESFFPKLNFLTELKLRLSYGLAGNNRINDYLFLSLYQTNTAPYTLGGSLIPGYSIASLANPSLKWETTVSRNLGMDVSFLNKRLQLTVDAYINKTRDLLINVPIASNSGFSNQLQNVGSTRNKGIEVQLNAAAINGKNFKWNINFNIAHNDNRVVKLSSMSDRIPYSSGWGAGNEYLVQVGKPIGTIWGYQSDGMYAIDDFNYDAARRLYTLKPGVADNTPSVGTPAPGTKKLKDRSGDGIVNINDQTIIGNARPKFTGGLNNQFSYKGFDASVFVNFVYGNNILNGDKVEFSNYFGTDANLLSMMNNRFRTITPDGVQLLNQNVGAPPEVLAANNKNATIWQPIKGGNYLLLDDWAIENGSFLRLNNVSIGYTLPEKLVNRIKIKGLRVYITGTNLAVLTSYSGLDPEVSTKNYSYVTPGVDSSPYPRSRGYIIGANIKF